MNEDKAAKRMTDGLLAGSGAFIASDAMAQQVQTGQHEADTFMQILIPVLTGVVLPFLKEWALEVRSRRKERKKRRNETAEASI